VAVQHPTSPHIEGVPPTVHAGFNSAADDGGIAAGHRSWHGFGTCWWGTIHAPVAALRRVAAEPSLVYPTLAAALFPALYSASILWTQLFVRRAPPSWEPWVSVIPRETYYLWEAAFLVPVTLLMWLLFGALGHRLARAVGGRGTFDATLAVLAFSLSVPLSMLIWLPDLLQALAGVFWGWPFNDSLVAVYGTLATLWALSLSALGLRIVQHLSWTRAATVAAVAMALGYGPGVLLLIR
jgi:hypothetical protein